VYFPIGIPIHVITIVNGNTDHYEVFPGWYSFAILPLMLAMIVFFARLRNADREEGDQTGR
jgi:cytochrome oxidase assembly protein ShyY1